MAKNKTTETDVNVTEFIHNVANETRRNDSFKLIGLYQSLTGFEPKMWGPTIIGFGNYHYKYASGHEGDMPLAAFSPRKDALVFYLNPVFEQREELLEQLGKHKSSKGCVYVKKLEDINTEVLVKMIGNCMNHTKKMYPDQP